jgi:RNA polymerase sigma-70 factor (ECF subfamily)
MLMNFFYKKKLENKLNELRPRLYRMAVSWCSDAMLADDLVQETLNKALVKQSQLKDFSHIKAWLFKILHNCWMQHLRSKKPSLDIDNIELLDQETPEKLFRELRIVERVRKAVEMLPLNQRQVITLIDLEGNSYHQVSEILDIPIGTVMSRLSRARSQLKNRLIKKTIEIPKNITNKHLQRLV